MNKKRVCENCEDFKEPAWCCLHLRDVFYLAIRRCFRPRKGGMR